MLGSLRDLDLSFSKLTDAGVPHLLAVANIGRLRLRGTKVTRSGAEVLSRLPELAWLNLAGTDLGWWDRVRLRRALPKVTVVVDGEG